MTKEQAIELIKEYKVAKVEFPNNLQEQALDMAIKALEQNTVPQETYDSEYLARKQAEYELWKIKEQQPSDGCVSRAEVFEIMGNLMSIPYDFDRPINKDDVSESMDEIRALTPITPTRKQGKWDKGYGFPDGAYWKCSCCNELIKVRYPMNYCPNCGAEMRGDDRC